MRHELLDAADVLREQRPRVRGLHFRFPAGVPDDADEGLRIEPGQPPGLPAQLDGIGRRRLAMETHGRAEEHHDGALARLEQLELPLAVATGGEHALPEVEELAHRLGLDLSTQIRRRDTNPIKWRRAVQHAMSLLNVGVLHRENVRRASPLLQRQRERRRVARLAPRADDGRDRVEPRDVERIDENEDVVVRLPRNVLTARRRAVEHDTPELGPERGAQLRDQFFESHFCHGSPAPARTATSASAPASKPSEPAKSAAAKSASESPAAPAATASPPASAGPSTAAPSAAHRDKDWQTPTATASSTPAAT